MSSYPATIFSPRERENWPGIIYDPDKKTLGFAEDFNLSDEEIVAIETVLGVNPMTTANIVYYVDPDDGDDFNPGTEAEPFKTIQHAIDLVPKCIRHEVTIYLEPSLNYSEAVTISGFYGSGEIDIYGRSGTVTDVLITYAGTIFNIYNCSVSKIDFRNFSARVTVDNKYVFRPYLAKSIYVQNVKAGDAGNTGTRFFYAARLVHAVLVSCSDYDAAKVAIGVYSEVGSIVGVSNSVLGDTNYAVAAGGMITDGSSFKP